MKFSEDRAIVGGMGLGIVPFTILLAIYLVDWRYFVTF